MRAVRASWTLYGRCGNVVWTLLGRAGKFDIFRHIARQSHSELTEFVNATYKLYMASPFGVTEAFKNCW